MFDIPEGTICVTKLPGESRYQELVEQTPWEQKPITIFGKTFMQPRLIAWYGEPGKTYGYSGASFTPLPFTPVLDALKGQIEEFTGATFNSVLLNWYRNGADSIGFHSDDEPELGNEPVIASLSFGGSREFVLKHKAKRHPNLIIPLGDNDLLIMMGETQKNWVHGVNKLKPSHPAFDQGRVNLTFRRIGS
jgi:alkylated DNA repair dioxygenase AlkB